MLKKKELKQKYEELSRDQKVFIGTALVKVNMGVAQPEDLRTVASFLKGSVYIAKAGKLDHLITYLHSDESYEAIKKKNEIESQPTAHVDLSALDELEDFEEDSVVTQKEKIE